jgi:hypothetical protein
VIVCQSGNREIRSDCDTTVEQENRRPGVAAKNRSNRRQGGQEFLFSWKTELPAFVASINDARE